MRYASLPVVLWLLCSSLPARAEVRTWTDLQGRTTKAEFVRVFQGRAVLKAGTQTLQIPLSQLSEQDQQYVASQLNRKAGKDKDNDAAGQPVRFWTDVRGNQMAASFVQVNGTQVVLNDAGQPRQFNFVELSEQDREHIKGLLREQGQEAQIAVLDSHVEALAKAAAAQQEGHPSSAPASPAASGNSALDRMRQRNEERRQAEEERRQAYEQQQAAERERRQQQAEEAKQRAEERQQVWQQQTQETQQRRQEQAQQRSEESLGTTTITEFRCSKCNKVVPGNISAGGNCPHCGVYFEYTESPTGQRQYSPAGSSSWSNVRVTGRAIKGVIFLVVLVCSGVAALWRKFAS